MKVAVYCPVKNEFPNIDAWYQSCQDADYICVLDTGSTDGTVEKLRSLEKVKVTEVLILPWRFDDAFNMAMYTVPGDADVCIRLDLDERLQSGWRDALESDWRPGTTRLRYPYVWNWNPDGTPGRQWFGDRIHSRTNYRWIGPTHEYLMCRGKETLSWTTKLRIHQYPASKNKSGDLSLLQEFVREYPHDSRAMAYLGREYIYQRDFKNASTTYRKFLDMESNPVERCQSLMYLAEAEPKNAPDWLEKAHQELPDHREPLVKMAEYFYQNKQWEKCLEHVQRALKITAHPMTYICLDDAWSWKPYDLAAIALWNLEKYDQALHHGKEAAKLNPKDPRLQKNLEFYQNPPTA